ncbi:alpha/beta hydrolase [Xylariaceae sp. FL0255]|nr:alpha/beta hydrolase [Xylariaceae sp. FL0255]
MSSRDSQTLKLQNGRVLGFAEYGSPTGKPLFYFHGFPSSRYEAIGIHEICKRQDLRIIAPDRPGFGLSTFVPDRQITDWPEDVRALASHLGLTRFAVLGCSGGGPYALACAHALPSEMLSGVGLLASAGPWKEAGSYDAPLASRLTAFMTYWWPASVRALLSVIVGFSKWLVTTGPITRRMDKWLEKKDKEKATKKARAHDRAESDKPSSSEVSDGIIAASPGSDEAKTPERTLQERREAFFLHFIFEAFRQGAAGTIRDSQLLTWEGLGFPIEDVSYDKVHIWHGTKDWQSPIRMIRFLAQHLQHCELHEFDGINHYAMANFVETVVETLVPRGEEEEKDKGPDRLSCEKQAS